MIRALIIVVYLLLMVNAYFWGYGTGFDHGYLHAMWDVKFEGKTPDQYFEERYEK